MSTATLKRATPLSTTAPPPAAPLPTLSDCTQTHIGGQANRQLQQAGPPSSRRVNQLTPAGERRITPPNPALPTRSTRALLSAASPQAVKVGPANRADQKSTSLEVGASHDELIDV